MDKKFKDLAYTLSANVLNFLMGIITGFIIPKFLGIDDYAYLKLFTFYVGYVGIAHLGLLDGIYIKYGSYDYEKLPKDKFRAYTKVFIIFQIVEAIVLSIITVMFIQDGNRLMIMLFVMINLVIMNITTLFSFIQQFTKRFKLFSINTILTKLLYVVGCLLLIMCNLLGYMNFVVLQTVINIIILVIYVYYNRELVFGQSKSLKWATQESIELIKIGFFVMIGNFTTMLILGMDRLFVDFLFTKEDFAMYSFAYSLISLFFLLLNSITMVMYPYLTRAKEDDYKVVYEGIRTSITILMSITLSGYFVIKFIVINFIPEYIASFNILIFLIPTVIYSGQINILIANYYKVLKKTKEYTQNNIVALVLGFITNMVAYLIFKDVKAIAAATLVSFVLWMIYSDLYFKKVLNLKILIFHILDLVVMAIFFFCAYTFNWLVGMVMYLVLLSIFIFLNNRKDLMVIVNMVKRR